MSTFETEVFPTYSVKVIHTGYLIPEQITFDPNIFLFNQ